jgi:hypothetical protein
MRYLLALAIVFAAGHANGVTLTPVEQTQVDRLLGLIGRLMPIDEPSNERRERLRDWLTERVRAAAPIEGDTEAAWTLRARERANAFIEEYRSLTRDEGPRDDAADLARIFRLMADHYVDLAHFDGGRSVRVLGGFLVAMVGGLGSTFLGGTGVALLMLKAPPEAQAVVPYVFIGVTAAALLAVSTTPFFAKSRAWLVDLQDYVGGDDRGTWAKKYDQRFWRMVQDQMAADPALAIYLPSPTDGTDVAGTLTTRLMFVGEGIAPACEALLEPTSASESTPTGERP